MVKIQYPVPKQRIQHSEPKRAKTIQVCVQGSQTQSRSTVNHQNVEENATQSKKSIANYKFAIGVLHSETISDPGTTEDETANGTDLANFPMVESDTETIIPNLAPDLPPKTIDSDVIPCPYVDLTSESEDETANDTDLAHLPMVKSDTETIIPNLAPDLVSDLAPETIDLNTFGVIYGYLSKFCLRSCPKCCPRPCPLSLSCPRSSLSYPICLSKCCIRTKGEAA